MFDVSAGFTVNQLSHRKVSAAFTVSSDVNAAYPGRYRVRALEQLKKIPDLINEK
jgi:hypothetical protein